MGNQIEHKLTNHQLLNTCVKYGMIGSIIYAGFFLLMRMLGLAHVTELRFFNYVVMCFVSYFALKQATYFNSVQPRFFTDMAIIFCTCVMSFVFFGIFIYFYSMFDSFILSTFNNTYPGSLAFGKFSAPLFIASEGIGLSAIAALGMTFYFRWSREKRKGSVDIRHELI